MGLLTVRWLASVNFVPADHVLLQVQAFCKATQLSSLQEEALQCLDPMPRCCALATP